MGDERATIHVTLNWLNKSEDPVRLENLPDFFKREDKQGESYGKKGGIYFWIHQGTRERIAYIGEAGCFQDRFLNEGGHIFQVFHGMRSTFACDGDLLTTYSKCTGDYSFQGKGSPYYNSVFGESKSDFEKSAFNWGSPESLKKIVDDPDGYIRKIQDGIELSVNYLRKMHFVFAEITHPDAKGKEGGAIRKQIEALFMLKLLTKRGDKQRWYYDTTPRNAYFWGTVSQYPKNKHYSVNNEGYINTGVLEELGLKERQWELYYDGNKTVDSD